MRTSLPCWRRPPRRTSEFAAGRADRRKNKERPRALFVFFRVNYGQEPAAAPLVVMGISTNCPPEADVTLTDAGCVAVPLVRLTTMEPVVGSLPSVEKPCARIG